jgi:hypothetical protein
MVTCSLLWVPFDVRFKDLLAQMKYHKELVKSELSILQARAASNAVEAAIQERLVADKERRYAHETRLKIERMGIQTEEIKENVERSSRS